MLCADKLCMAMIGFDGSCGTIAFQFFHFYVLGISFWVVSADVQSSLSCGRYTMKVLEVVE